MLREWKILVRVEGGAFSPPACPFSRPYPVLGWKASLHRHMVMDRAKKHLYIGIWLWIGQKKKGEINPPNILYEILLFRVFQSQGLK